MVSAKACAMASAWSKCRSISPSVKTPILSSQALRTALGPRYWQISRLETAVPPSGEVSRQRPCMKVKRRLRGSIARAVAPAVDEVADGMLGHAGGVGDLLDAQPP